VGLNYKGKGVPILYRKEKKLINAEEATINVALGEETSFLEEHSREMKPWGRGKKGEKKELDRLGGVNLSQQSISLKGKIFLQQLLSSS